MFLVLLEYYMVDLVLKFHACGCQIENFIKCLHKTLEVIEVVKILYLAQN